MAFLLLAKLALARSDSIPTKPPMTVTIEVINAGKKIGFLDIEQVRNRYNPLLISQAVDKTIIKIHRDHVLST